MNKILIAIITTFIFSFVSTGIKAQVSISSYSIYSFGVKTSSAKKISGDLKMFANRDFEDLLFETNAFYNFKERQYHRFSVGAGFMFRPFSEGDFFSAFTVPVSLEFYPLPEYRKVSGIFELAPEIYPESGVHIRHLWGIRYTFGK